MQSCYELGRATARRRGRRAFVCCFTAAASAVPFVGRVQLARGDIAHKFDSTVTGDFHTATTWNPSGVPAADAVAGTNRGDMAVVDSRARM